MAPERTRVGHAASEQGRVQRRGRARSSRSDRRGEHAAERHHGRAGRRAGEREEGGQPAADGTPSRRAVHDQGEHRRPGDRDDPRCPGVRGRACRPPTHPRRTDEGGRRYPPRAYQHARAGAAHRHRQSPPGAHQQPVGPGRVRRGLERRRGCGAGGRHDAVGSRQRHRWLAAQPGVLQRGLRAKADQRTPPERGIPPSPRSDGGGPAAVDERTDGPPGRRSSAWLWRSCTGGTSAIPGRSTWRSTARPSGERRRW